jgi:FAD/FMN-containing dehydrogenase
MVDKALVIDMRAMKAVEVDAEALVVTAEGGCKLGEIDAAMEPHKIAVPWGALCLPSRLCLARSPARHPHHPFITFSSSVGSTLLSANTQHTSHNMLRCTRALTQRCLSTHFKENHIGVTLNSQNNLKHHRLCFVPRASTGTNPDTGVAGLTLAGGAGFLSRLYGFTVDNVLAFDAVLPDGQKVRVLLVATTHSQTPVSIVSFHQPP